MYYTQTIWLDLKITTFLNGLFYVLRLPSSNYVIRRFLNSFVILETDIWLCHCRDFKYCFTSNYYFAYVTQQVFKLFLRATRKRQVAAHRVKRKRKRNTFLGIVYSFLGRRTSVRIPKRKRYLRTRKR